jgi:hypothetical protein
MGVPEAETDGPRGCGYAGWPNPCGYEKDQEG